MNRRRWLMLAGLMTAGMAAWVKYSSTWMARFLRERIAETGRAIPAAPHHPMPKTWKDDQITLAWIGHATVLINFYGVRILTDPALFSCIGPDLKLFTLGPKRLIKPALSVDELPDIDVLLLSHAHFDHFDIPSLKAIPGKPIVVTARFTQDLLPDRPCAEILELGCDDSRTLQTKAGELEVQAIQTKHWGARWQRDRYRSYNGYIISRNGRKILFAGDTTYTPVFAEYRKRGPFEIALMPIGAYNPWIHAHCTPEQALQMANDAGARHIGPIHHQTFKLSSEPALEPIQRLQAALTNEPERLAFKKIGETFELKLPGINPAAEQSPGVYPQPLLRGV